MSADSHRLFPLPRTGSGSWRTYWMQRRDNGDAQTHCPDIVSEAEKLFGMSHGTGTYPRYDSNSAYMDSACDFTTLRGLQNSEWAQSIAQSAPSKIDKHNQSEVLGMLDHALALDPQCVTALQHRANL
ncbi:hypothetical protein LPJ66_001355 [Kickxella alabastrina]|uniref:Uncharacterized protein n=1 Tax=Kickxella alabastrina TaxID=61397 RepID=A0ACC1ITG4_9FUNG|nr:hypothetical protein LPJ66_001355 [Kickxella alabastrina]